MLHKSFKPAKCKTTLKLAVSRIKLLKNKRDAQVKHLKRELAQLLESGQDQTARIRVEHVVREEKTMAAYDLIEIYCELIVARMLIIESQKNCPIDLKEAVSSVIFASPRCADIPELMDVRKHFTAKYGKEFVSSAVELLPDCGVSRLLVEKLSAKAPDGPTKKNILTAIAAEHNIKWDPNSFGENEMKPPEDLLNGPSTFGHASKMHVESPNVQGAHNIVDKEHHSVRAPATQSEKHDAPVNSYGSNSRPSSHFQNVSSSTSATNEAMQPDSSYSDPRRSGTGYEEMEFRHSKGQSDPSAGRQSWNMEFTDATAAAQAAAESAERASMAARAAAELSSQGRLSRQHSTESNKSSVFRSRDERLSKYARDEIFNNNASSRLQSEHLAREAVNNTSHRSNSERDHEQSFGNEQDDPAGLAERFNNLKTSYMSSQLASSKSNNNSVDDYPHVSDFQMVDRHSGKTSSELERSEFSDEENIKRESSESEKEFLGEVRDGLRSDHPNNFDDTSIRKQSSSVSSHSYSKIPSDNYNPAANFSNQEFSEDVTNEPYVFHEGEHQSSTKETNSFGNAAAVFDDSGSDDDEFMFDEKRKNHDQDSALYYSSEGRKSCAHLLANTSNMSPRLTMEKTLGKSNSQSPFALERQPSNVFSEDFVGDTVPLKADDLLHVTFDDSDGPSSGSEEELDKAKVVGSTNSSSLHQRDFAYTSMPELTWDGSPRSVGSSHEVKENVESNREKSAHGSDVEIYSERNQGAETDKKFSYGYLHSDQTSYRPSKSRSNSNDNDNLQAPGSIKNDVQIYQSSIVSEDVQRCQSPNVSDNVQRYQSPNVSDDVQRYQSPNVSDDVQPIKESSLGSGNELNFGVLTGGLRNKGYRHPPYRRNSSSTSAASKQAGEDKSSSIENSSSSLKVDSGAHNQEPQKQPKATEKPSLGVPVQYSDAIEDESDEELLQQTVSSSQEPNIRKSGTEVDKRSGLKSYFDSDSDFEEDIPKQTVTSNTRSGPGFSRRTKASGSNSEKDSYSKFRVPSESSTAVKYTGEQKPSSMGSYPTAQVKLPSQIRTSSYWGNPEEQVSSDEQATKLNSQYKGSVYEESSSRRRYSNDNQQNHSYQLTSSDYRGKSQQRKPAEPSKPQPESKRSSREESMKSSAREQPSNPPPRTASSSGSESTKASSSQSNPPSRENSTNKASHVHPKLPDYDTFAATLLSFRQNRQ